ncbi:ATP-binding protein [Siphonobacter sp. BAB-5385]|uniref:ATP-binding protein n=1 Tax=Siphonobacter sp. BAB-5385 TaxID=1864822 RepID=UPI001595D10E|nr:ATP-binding protein [Siphonobacter sp. BAB-5385]
MHADAYAQQLLGIAAQADGQMFLKCFQLSSQNQVYSLFEQASREALEVDFTVQRSGEAGQWVRLWGSSGREDESVVLRGVVQAVAPPADLTRLDPLQSFFELLDDSLVGLALLDGKELTYLRVNACYAALKGKTAEELLGKSFPRTLPQGEVLEKSLRQGLSSGVALRVKEVEVPLPPTENRPIHYIDLTFQPQWDEARQGYTQILVIATDVTGQVHLRKELEAQKAQLEQVIQSAPVSIARLIGPDFRLSTVNRAFIEIAGKGPVSLNTPLVEVMPEIEGQPFLTLLEEVYTKREVFEQKALPAWILEKGEVRHKFFNVCYAPLLQEDGQSYGVLCFSIDVTDQVKLQKRIEQSSQSLQNAVDLAELGTWNIHVEEKILSFSRSVTRWIGFTSALTFEQIDSMALNAKMLEEAYRQALSLQGERRLEVEFEIVNPRTQQTYTLYALGNTHFNDQGRATHIRGFVRDVTPERKMQQVLESKVEDRTRELATSNENLQASNEELVLTNEYLSRSNESLEQFAFVASHDLQEPLRKIRQFCDLLVKQYDRDRVLNETYLDRIRYSAARMSELVSDLLAFSQISNATPELKLVDLNKILDRVQENLSVSLEETQAQLQIAPLPNVMGDTLQLEQLWQNLVSNALKFSSKDQSGHKQIPQIVINAQVVPLTQLPGQLQLKARMYHQLSIQDNGVGFDEKYAERIFGVFQRLHGKSEFKGSGIGLSICQKVAHNHGGLITAESQLGKGALFHVYLPLHP